MTSPGHIAQEKRWNQEQLRAIESEGRDVVVAAGAGTGKTSVLVQRVVRKLVDGSISSLSRLLVVTFTDKAAREMRERLYRVLSADRRFFRHVAHLPRAHISTIHAFCGRVLRENFLLADVEPGFRILETHGRFDALQSAITRAFHDWYRHDDAGIRREFLGLVEVAGFGAEGERLREVVLGVYERARTHPDPEAVLARLAGATDGDRGWPWVETATLHLQQDVHRAAGVYKEAVGLAQHAGMRVDRQWAFLESLYALEARAADPAKARRVLDVMREDGSVEEVSGRECLRVPRAPSGSKALAGFAEAHETAREVLSQVDLRVLTMTEDECQREATALGAAARVLIDLVRRVDGEYEAFKRRNGFLDFSDLELRMRRLLRIHGSQLDLPARFDEVLVDEVQDVNPLQEEILSGVSRPGRCFRVGDLKQSIYGFRLADPSIFARWVSGPLETPDRAAERDVVFLRENHRSRAPIIDTVNHIFSQLFRSEDIGSSYAEQALVPAREDSRPAAAVDLDLIAIPPRRKRGHAVDQLGDLERLSREERTKTLADVLTETTDIPAASSAELQARWIARRIAAMRDDVPLGDVALLLRSGTHASVYEDALLREGIPARVLGGTSLLDEPGTRDFHQLLCLIDNPRNDVVLASVLRSPLVGLDDAELLRIRFAAKEAETFAEAVSQAATDTATFPKVDAFLRKLESWREAEQVLGLAELSASLLAETDYPVLLRARGEGTVPQRHLDRYLSLMRAYEAERGPSLRGFLGRMEILNRSGGLDTGGSEDAATDAVTVLTVHKAKGLEFPVVVVPQLEWRVLGHNELGSRLRTGDSWVGLRLLDSRAWVRRDTLARATLQRMDEERSRQEEARVLYVALTRARDRLILVGATRRRPWEEPAMTPVLAEASRWLRRQALDWILDAFQWSEAAVLPVDPLEHVLGETREGEVREGSADSDEVRRRFEFSPPGVVVQVIPARDVEALQPGDATTGRTSEEGAELPEEDTRDAARMWTTVETRLEVPPLARLEQLRGKYWVTELKRPDDGLLQQRVREEAGSVWLSSTADGSDAPAEARLPERTLARDEAARTGALYHVLLARLDLSQTEEPALREQIEAAASSEWWGTAPRDLALEEGLIRVFQGELGDRLRDADRIGMVHREVAFSLKWSAARLLDFVPDLREGFDSRWTVGQWEAALRDEWVLLQGRVDCLFRSGEEWHVVDWKTDRIEASVPTVQAQRHAAQMEIYEEAAASLWGTPVRSFVCFLRPAQVVPMGTRRN